MNACMSRSFKPLAAAFEQWQPCQSLTRLVRGVGAVQANNDPRK